jgi:hypothetical protein
MVSTLGEKQTVKVLIVDDHPAVREALSARISSQPDLEVCGEAEGVAQALRLVSEKKPDIIIVDISLSDGDTARRPASSWTAGSSGSSRRRGGLGNRRRQPDLGRRFRRWSLRRKCPVLSIDWPRCGRSPSRWG